MSGFIKIQQSSKHMIVCAVQTKKTPEKQQKCVCYASNNVLLALTNRMCCSVVLGGRVRLTAVYECLPPQWVCVCVRNPQWILICIMYYTAAVATAHASLVGNCFVSVCIAYRQMCRQTHRHIPRTLYTYFPRSRFMFRTRGRHCCWFGWWKFKLRRSRVLNGT